VFGVAGKRSSAGGLFWVGRSEGNIAGTAGPLWVIGERLAIYDCPAEGREKKRGMDGGGAFKTGEISKKSMVKKLSVQETGEAHGGSFRKSVG